MKIVICLAALLALPLSAQAQDPYPEHELAVRLVQILTANYDRQPVDTAMEGIIKQAGRKSYHKLLQDWLVYRSNLEHYSPEIEPAYTGLLRTLKKELPEEHEVFLTHIGNLTMLTLRNFQIFFDAVQEYNPGLPLQNLDSASIDASLAQGDYPAQQRELIALEEIIKKEIRQIITRPEVAGKLGFYIFFFDQIAQTRKKSIDKLLESLVAKAQ